MKTIDDAKFEYLDNADLSCDIIEQNMNAFDAGVKFAQRWIPTNEEKPKFEGKEFAIIGIHPYSPYPLMISVESQEDIDNFVSDWTHWRPVEYM